LRQSSEGRRLSIMVDYLLGKGVSRGLPKSGLRIVYSRRSGRPKLVFHDDKLFATIRPNGVMAFSLYGASTLSASPKFKENCVQVKGEAVPFVVGGMSVFCKFVRSAGDNVYPRSEVAVVDPDGRVVGVGTAVLNGRHMAGFKSGVAVKVRDGLGR
jgi:conserved protein with predicted RNA binding PUA domain